LSLVNTTVLSIVLEILSTLNRGELCITCIAYVHYLYCLYVPPVACVCKMALLPGCQVGDGFSILFGHIMRMDDNADAKRILLASAPAD